MFAWRYNSIYNYEYMRIRIIWGSKSTGPDFGVSPGHQGFDPSPDIDDASVVEKVTLTNQEALITIHKAL
jgi:hypothetical protein